MFERVEHQRYLHYGQAMAEAKEQPEVEDTTPILKSRDTVPV